MTTLNQQWNGIGWDNQYQFFYTYDANNNRISSLRQTWNGSWTDVSRDSLAYDSNNNCTYIFSEDWNGLSWNASSQQFLTYDGNNNLIHSLFHVWNGTVWSNASQWLLTYNANNSELTNLLQFWDGASWFNVLLLGHTYDANNLMVSLTVRHFDNAGIYIDQGDSIYYYYHTISSSVLSYVTPGDEEIILYPDPLLNELRAEGSVLDKLTDFKIFDAAGQEVKEEFNFSTEISGVHLMDVSELRAGIYVAVFNCGNRSYREKFIKSR